MALRASSGEKPVESLALAEASCLTNWLRLAHSVFTKSCFAILGARTSRRAACSLGSAGASPSRNHARSFSAKALVLLAVLALMPAHLALASDDGRSQRVDFNFQVRPILSDKCFNCHGPDARNRKAGLRLDIKEGAFGTTQSGAHALVAGDLEASELYWRITAEDESERMPPKSLGRSLSAGEVKLLKRWIEQGAEWKTHWALLPPEAAAPPLVQNAGRANNPLDRFVLARLDEQGLKPAPEANKERLVRRVTFDLTGLPPTVAEIDAFLADTAPGTYERLIERLLASPRFGERMAVDWLDLARYADTYGYQADVYRAMWPWRDWVVQAFNVNLAYDQFVTWQLAGDLMPRPSHAQVLATAFNRHHRQTNEGGSIEEEFRAEYVADRTNTVATAFLGLTFECARCHSHKYDPITQKEYYSLFAFFNNIDESGLYSHFTDAVPTPTLRLTTDGQDRDTAAVESQIKNAESDLDRLVGARLPEFEKWLKSARREPLVPGLIGDFPLDDLIGSKVANRASSAKAGQVIEGPELIEGRIGKALRLSGENNVTLPLGNFDRFEAFSLSLWIKTPDYKDRAVVLHRSMAWTDAGSRGYQLLIEDGKLSAGLIHFWPGNAIGIRAQEPLALNRWVHVALSYDGSSRAGGLVLYIDGHHAACEVVRDCLTKNITGGGNDQITVGQRFRDRGFKNGAVDEIKVFNRAITSIEAAHLWDGKTLARTLTREPAKLSDRERHDLLAYYLSTVDADYKSGLAALKVLRQKRSALADPVPEIMVMKEQSHRPVAYVLKRGAYDAPGEQVEPGTPASLPPFERAWPRNRLGLAHWLTAPGHPLLARVAVNRWWQAFFGRGIVATPEDFGSQGQLPTHPELLDWLARGFIDSGWDTKRLIRLIVTSATYRQSSDVPAELLARDPDNAFLARGPSFRLPAEMIRDGALAAGGILVGSIGGPPVKPYQPPGLWEEKSGLAFAAACTHFGSGHHPRRPCSPSTRPPGKSAPSSGRRLQRRSRPLCFSMIPSSSRLPGRSPSVR
jgi:Protein of unknown function (DUF1549)/Protein of unknown function (DUF1553)/Concanavalin A-like lectin/glucanases superfamily/Planctomycete cytochrome C